MSLFKRDPKKKLTKAYEQKMQAAMLAMRKGDVRQNALLVAQAQQIKQQLDQTA